MAQLEGPQKAREVALHFFTFATHPQPDASCCLLHCRWFSMVLPHCNPGTEERR